MKQPIFSALIALLCIATIGCKKDTDNLGTMSAVVYSDEYNATACSAVSTNGWHIIKGNANNNESITFFIKAPLLATTYNLVDTLTDHHGSYDDGTVKHRANSGTVTIKSVNNTKVTGTFMFRCADGTIVTDGKFTAAY